MSERAAPCNVLFLCTGNSARSILGEALLNAAGDGRFLAHSAGSQPVGTVNPHALELLERLGFETGSCRSKSWDEFSGPDAPTMDFVFTACDRAASESCPIWSGRPMTANWRMPDPAAAQGSDVTSGSPSAKRTADNNGGIDFPAPRLRCRRSPERPARDSCDARTCGPVPGWFGIPGQAPGLTDDRRRPTRVETATACCVPTRVSEPD